mgnify:FL=1
MDSFISLVSNLQTLSDVQVGDKLITYPNGTFEIDTRFPWVQFFLRAKNGDSRHRTIDCIWNMVVRLEFYLKYLIQYHETSERHEIQNDALSSSFSQSIQKTLHEDVIYSSTNYSSIFQRLRTAMMGLERLQRTYDKDKTIAIQFSMIRTKLQIIYETFKKWSTTNHLSSTPS